MPMVSSRPVRVERRSMRERVVAFWGSSTEVAVRRRRWRWSGCGEVVVGRGRARSWVWSFVSVFQCWGLAVVGIY